MTISIGTDIVEIQRLSATVERQGDRFVKRILAPAELNRWSGITNADSRLAFLAKRFAAKEAIAKALGTGIAKGIGWQQMLIVNNEQGAPEVELSGAASERLVEIGGSKVLISISDEKHYAVAFCTII